VGAGLGTLLGIPFGLPGVLIGPLAGAVLGELSVHRRWRRASGVAVAAWIGFLIGTAVKVAAQTLRVTSRSRGVRNLDSPPRLHLLQ
jgi:uncharacterized protein YqgC (DUF456 family)